MQFSVSIQQRTDSTLELPMWLLQAPLVIGLILSAFQAVAVIIDSFEHPESLTDGPQTSDL